MDVAHSFFPVCVFSPPTATQAGVKGTLGRLLGIFEVSCRTELYKVRSSFEPLLTCSLLKSQTEVNWSMLFVTDARGSLALAVVRMLFIVVTAFSLFFSFFYFLFFLFSPEPRQ